MTENAATKPDGIPGLYAELTALRVEMAARALIQEQGSRDAWNRNRIDITVDISGHERDGVMPKQLGIIDWQGRHLMASVRNSAVNRKTGAEQSVSAGKYVVGRERAVGLPINKNACFFLVRAWGRNSVDGVFRMHFADGRNDAPCAIVGKNINDWGVSTGTCGGNEDYCQDARRHGKGERRKAETWVFVSVSICVGGKIPAPNR